MRVPIEFELQCSRKQFLKWLEQFTMKSQVHSIKQDDGSGIRLQPMRLRVAREPGSENRLDCLFEGIYEPASGRDDPYVMGAVLEFQMLSKGEGGCRVTAIMQHHGVTKYFDRMIGEIGRTYPEAQVVIEKPVDISDVKSADTETTRLVTRGRPRKPEYEVAWRKIQSGMDFDSAYQIYLRESGAIDDRKVKKCFFQAMRYRLHRTERN